MSLVCRKRFAQKCRRAVIDFFTIAYPAPTIGIRAFAAWRLEAGATAVTGRYRPCTRVLPGHGARDRPLGGAQKVFPKQNVMLGARTGPHEEARDVVVEL